MIFIITLVTVYIQGQIFDFYLHIFVFVLKQTSNRSMETDNDLLGV